MWVFHRQVRHPETTDLFIKMGGRLETTYYMKSAHKNGKGPEQISREAHHDTKIRTTHRTQEQNHSNQTGTNTTTHLHNPSPTSQRLVPYRSDMKTRRPHCGRVQPTAGTFEVEGPSSKDGLGTAVSLMQWILISSLCAYPSIFSLFV
jgi:hypothetical protein